MANFDVKPQFDTAANMIQPTDPARADLFNGHFGRLYNNDAYLKEQVDNSKTTQTTTGNNPTADNSTNGNVIYLKDSGYTEQKTLSGKNLFDVKSVYGSKTNYSIDNDGIVTSTVTSDSRSWGYDASEFKKTLSSGTYHLKIFSDKYTSVTNSGLLVVNASGKELLFKSGANTWNTEYTFTLTENTDVGIMLKPFDSKFKVMLTKDIDITDYEPYCGGVASPNPDYPQRIGGLADKGYFDGALYGGYYDPTTGAKTQSNTGGTVCSNNYMETKENDIVELVYEESVNYLWVSFYDSNKGYLSRQRVENAKELSVTAPTNAKYFTFTIQKNSGITPTTAKHICVTINGQYAVAVKTQGKNLLNAVLNTTIGNNNGYAFDVKPNTSYTLSLTQKCVAFDEAKPKAQHWYKLYDENGVVLSQNAICLMTFSKVDEILTRTQTIKTGSKTRRISIDLGNYNAGSTLKMQTIEAQFEEGEVATPFEPYTETQALIPISVPLYDGDYIEVYADGSGQIVRENRLWYPSATLNWRVVTNNANRYTANIPSDILGNMKVAAQGKKADAYSNIAVSSTWASLLSNMGVFCLSYDGYIAFAYDGTVDEFKEMLTQTNAYVVYKLTTPTTEQLTAEQVSEFMKLQTFKGITHVTADGEVTIRYYCNNDSGDTMKMQIVSHIGMVIHSTTLDTMEKVVSIYGGKAWEKIEGRFLLGQSDTYEIGAEGGEETHTLTIEELPSHIHNVSMITQSTQSKAIPASGETVIPIEVLSGVLEHPTITQSTGSNQSHNNMPPYKVVYIWERTE